MRDFTEINPSLITKEDDEVIFRDGFLYIISESREDINKVSIDRIILNAEWDDPISLADIAKRYPDCHKLIFEDSRKGEVYNHNNHQGESDEAWELVGLTIGYA